MKKALNVDIGKRIKAARERSGLTRESLAERIEVTPRFIADVERGSVGISVPTLIRICETLNISSDSLLWNKTTRISLDEKLLFVDAEYLPSIDKLVQNQIDLIDLIKAKESQNIKTGGSI